MASYSADGRWKIVGWYDIAKYREEIQRQGWQIRYQDPEMLIVRIPAGIGSGEAWHVAECKATSDIHAQWWLTVPRSRKILRDSLSEQFDRDSLAEIFADN